MGERATKLASWTYNTLVIIGVTIVGALIVYYMFFFESEPANKENVLIEPSYCDIFVEAYFLGQHDMLLALTDQDISPPADMIQRAHVTCETSQP